MGGTGASFSPASARSSPQELPWARVPAVQAGSGGSVGQGVRAVRPGGEGCAGSRSLTVTLCPACRMENLFINRFMHMFQSSWSDFADFEKIFVKISNTISGECACGALAVLGRLPGNGKGRPSCSSKAGLPGPAAQAAPRPGRPLHWAMFPGAASSVFPPTVRELPVSTSSLLPFL